MQNLSEKLMDCGMRRTLALVVEVLSDNEWHKFRDIERKADLRQPEVSQAVKEIRDYVEARKCDERQHDHGRCMQEVRMSRIRLDQFIDDLIAKKQEEVEKIKNTLNELKEF